MDPPPSFVTQNLPPPLLLGAGQPTASSHTTSLTVLISEEQAGIRIVRNKLAPDLHQRSHSIENSTYLLDRTGKTPVNASGIVASFSFNNLQLETTKGILALDCLTESDRVHRIEKEIIGIGSERSTTCALLRGWHSAFAVWSACATFRVSRPRRAANVPFGLDTHVRGTMIGLSFCREPHE